MGYIIENKKPLILTRLTAKGREKIAKGLIDWSFWSLGDSEVDYKNIELIPEEFGTSQVMKPKDFNPNVKTYLEQIDCSILQPISPAEKQTIECCVRNKALERGFFSGDTSELITNSDYIKTIGTVGLSQFNGLSTIDIGTVDFNDGDYIMFKITKPNIGVLSLSETEKPVLYLWYKIKKQSPISTIIEVDRQLPYFAFLSNIDVNFYIFPGGESITSYYGSGSTIPYWNSETLEFISQCDVTTEDVNVLNMNNVWNESLAGTQSIYEKYLNYGSIDYVGQKEYFGYNIDCPEIVQETGDCEDKLLNLNDDYIKGISIIHFSNLNISNDYGEKYFIDHDNDINLRLKFPTIMWHRRDFSGVSGTGNIIGMEFISSGDSKLVTNSDITYFDLVEDPTFISASGTPMVVGRVFPELKVVVIHDEELLAVMSYKSSRNFTLPNLKGKMISPQDGVGTGVLPKGKTMYVTYTMEANNGLQYFLPHQKYIKFINNTKIDRDIEFSLEDTGLLPYMRQLEQMGYDGLGFYANRFKLLVQIVDNPDDRPNPEKWVSINYTSNQITNVTNYTINPLYLERQTPQLNGFYITKTKYNSGSFYNLAVLNIPEIICPEDLQFGDERFFFGNLDCSIGACIYRTVFKLIIDASLFVKSSNPTWAEGNNLYFTEIGIYDSQQDLVAITKFSRPIKMPQGRKFAVELSLDF
jgi:hypothetical protein